MELRLDRLWSKSSGLLAKVHRSGEREEGTPLSVCVCMRERENAPKSHAKARTVGHECVCGPFLIFEGVPGAPQSTQLNHSRAMAFSSIRQDQELAFFCQGSESSL
ncbi:hypothetical protein AOLI_G00240660 [Acnodon oligacanthus]